MNSQARLIQCSYGNEVETLLSSCGHTYTPLGILIAREGKKWITEKLVNVGLILFSCHGRSRNFHIREKKISLILIVNKKFNIVNGVVWRKPLIF